MADVKDLLRCWANLMATHKQRLIELDGMVGDSDLGLTMADGYLAAYEAVKDNDQSDVGMLTYTAGKTMGAAVPSTMGTLMASGLMNAGKALRGVEIMEDQSWPMFFQAYFEGVQNRGKAQLGDKTFLDAFHPGLKALQNGAGDMQTAAPLAAKAAIDAFEATRGMLAKHGRMAIRGEDSRVYLDPGAAVAALLFEGFAQTMMR